MCHGLSHFSGFVNDFETAKLASNSIGLTGVAIIQGTDISYGKQGEVCIIHYKTLDEWKQVDVKPASQHKQPCCGE